MALRYYTKSTNNFVRTKYLNSEDSVFSQQSETSLLGDSEDFLLRFKLPIPPPSTSNISHNLTLLDNENTYDFTTDSEIITAIDEISRDQINYSEEYRRCCKVWLKIANLPMAKNFIWDVDTNIYPDYYSVIKNPINLSIVAYNLLKKSYSSNLSSTISITTSFSNSLIVASFYRDMRQVLLNCFTYNTESIVIVSQAQRLLQVLHRHVTLWILNDNLPHISTCSDQYCLYSSQPLISSTVQYVSIKCGRCLGVFSLDVLHNHKKEFGVIIPTEDQVHGTDEWYCMYCLREDSVISDELEGLSKGNFTIDEWGPSGLIPWQFNQNYGRFVDQILESLPQLSCMIEALNVLVSPNKTCIFQQQQPQLQNEFQSNASNNGNNHHQSEVKIWTLQERLCVFTGLCEVLKGHRITYQHLNEIYSECLKLSKMSLREPFHEADFMDQVMKISGTEGVILARSLLEGNDPTIIGEDTMKQIVIEGRCLICKESTFDDDCDGKSVLLCDGCNSEVHMTCVGLNSVRSLFHFRIFPSISFDIIIVVIFRFLKVHGIVIHVHNV